MDNTAASKLKMSNYAFQDSAEPRQAAEVTALKYFVAVEKRLELTLMSTRFRKIDEESTLGYKYERNNRIMVMHMEDTEELSPKGRPILKEDFVDELVRIPKYVPRGSKDLFKMKEDNGHLRSSVELISDRANYSFKLSTRKSIKDPVDFSVVFTYSDINGREYIIRRFNGDHGRHYYKNTNRYISGPHIHTITEAAQKEYHKDETEAVETDQYKTLEQAIEFAMKELNIRYEEAKGTKDLSQW
ncbi:hypothetical protein PED39_04160 [Methanomassiliicoccales archaeon LGM-RCC1]|nr:hypothetical protein PED39_04160 [Methanomassiliicoccales archaeon LGM-RCC1]